MFKLRRYRPYSIFILLVGVFGCAVSPLGRQQLKIFSDSKMNLMGSQSFSEMKKQIPIETDKKVNAYIVCISKPLIQQIDDPKMNRPRDWEIVVFKDKSANAFALPGRKIGVHTGLLDVARTPGQVAAVIGHEIGHVLAEHGNERVSEAFAVQGGLAVASVALGQKKSSNYNLMMAALGVGAQFGILLPHSRAQESEADIMGLQLMAKAGFDPSESVALWKNMASAGGGQPPEFLSTHPSHGTRIQKLKKNIPEVQKFYDEAKKRPECSL